MNLQYDRLKQIIPIRFQRVEHYTEASALTGNLVGYSIHDNYDELPVLTFEKFRENEWNHAIYYLNTHYTADMTNRAIIKVWHDHNAVQEFEQYIMQKFKQDKVHIQLHDRDIISIQILMNYEIYMDEILRVFGLFPDEVSFFKESGWLKFQINRVNMEHNDKMLMRCENE